MHGKTFLAPVENPAQVIDIGCGTGSITCGFGIAFPSAQVYGIDMAPIPIHSNKPKNVTFAKGDYHNLFKAEDANIKAESMDFIFSRLLVSGMTDWPSYIQQCYDLLKPGGYLEIQELEHFWYIDGQRVSTEWEWDRAYAAISGQKGLDLSCSLKTADWMREAGFEGVRTEKLIWPFGDWMARRGHIEYENFGKFLSEEQPLLYQKALENMLSAQGESEAKIGELQGKVLQTLKGAEGLYQKFWISYGQKPA